MSLLKLLQISDRRCGVMICIMSSMTIIKIYSICPYQNNYKMEKSFPLFLLNVCVTVKPSELRKCLISSSQVIMNLLQRQGGRSCAKA